MDNTDVDELCDDVENTNLEEHNWDDLCESYRKAEEYINFYNENRYFPMETNDKLVKPITDFLNSEFELKRRYFAGPFRPEYIEVNPDDGGFRMIVEELDYFIGELKRTIDHKNDILCFHDKLNELLIHDRKLTKHLIIYSKVAVRNCGCTDSYPTPFDVASDYEEEFNEGHIEGYYEDDMGYYYYD